MKVKAISEQLFPPFPDAQQGSSGFNPQTSNTEYCKLEALSSGCGNQVKKNLTLGL